MIFSTTNVFAKNEFSLTVNEEVQILDSLITLLEDSDEYYIVKEVKDNEITISINDKINNKLIVKKYIDENEETLISQTIYDINDLEKSNMNNLEENEISPEAVISSKYTEYGHYYEYDDYYNDWKLRRISPYQTKYVVEKSYNRSDIFGFKSAVDNIASAEFKGHVAVGSTLASAVINALALNGIGTALSLAGGVVALINMVYDVYRYGEDANLYYDRVQF